MNRRFLHFAFLSSLFFLSFFLVDVAVAENQSCLVIHRDSTILTQVEPLLARHCRIIDRIVLEEGKAYEYGPSDSISPSSLFSRGGDEFDRLLKHLRDSLEVDFLFLAWEDSKKPYKDKGMGEWRCLMTSHLALYRTEDQALLGEVEESATEWATTYKTARERCIEALVTEIPRKMDAMLGRIEERVPSSFDLVLVNVEEDVNETVLQATSQVRSLPFMKDTQNTVRSSVEGETQNIHIRFKTFADKGDVQRELLETLAQVPLLKDHQLVESSGNRFLLAVPKPTFQVYSVILENLLPSEYRQIVPALLEGMRGVEGVIDVSLVDYNDASMMLTTTLQFSDGDAEELDRRIYSVIGTRIGFEELAPVAIGGSSLRYAFPAPQEPLVLLPEPGAAVPGFGYQEPMSPRFVYQEQKGNVVRLAVKKSGWLGSEKAGQGTVVSPSGHMVILQSIVDDAETVKVYHPDGGVFNALFIGSVGELTVYKIQSAQIFNYTFIAPKGGLQTGQEVLTILPYTEDRTEHPMFAGRIVSTGDLGGTFSYDISPRAEAIGAPVFDSSGQLVGINIQSTTGEPEADRTTQSALPTHQVRTLLPDVVE